MNIQKLTKEDSILWFYLFGWENIENQENDTSSSDTR